MNKKISLGICISLIAIASAITFVITSSVTLSNYNNKIAGASQREEFITKYQEIDSYIRNNYKGDIQESFLINSLLKGYINGINDEFAEYHTNAEYYNLTQQRSGKIITSGIVAEKEESGYVRVIEVIDGTSAAHDNIEVGDIITVVNDSAVFDIGADEAIKKLDGDEGTRLNITTQRQGEEKKHVLIRQAVEINYVSASMVDETHGLIKISGFNDLTGGHFVTAIDSLIDSNPELKGIIFDLRDTKGTMVSPVRTMLNRLMPKTIVANAQYKNGNIDNFITTDDEKSVNLEMAVIVNSKTSGLAELFAAALKDFKGALIVGNQTAGKSSHQYTQVLKDGSAVTITVAEILPTGETVYKDVGIKPDYIQDIGAETMSIDGEIMQSDLQLQKAIDVLS